MKKQKLVSILLATAMMSGVLAGCGQTATGAEGKTSESATISSETKSSETSEVKVEELEEKTIQMWIMGAGKQKDSDKVYEVFNEMLQEYVPNTTVEIECITVTDYKTKFNQALAAKEAVDISWVGYGTDLSVDINDGNLMPLDELLDEYGTGIKEILGEETIDSHRAMDGSLYYIPSWQGMLADRRAYYVPTEFAALAGDSWLEDTQKVVTKWWNDYESTADLDAVFEQWDKYFAALKAEGKLYAGIGGHFAYNFEFPYGLDECVPYKSYVGVMHGDETYTVVDAVAQDQFKTWASHMADFYKKGYVRSDIASATGLAFVKKGVFNENTQIVYCHNYYVPQDLEKQSGTAGVELSAIAIENKPTMAKEANTGMAIPYCADEPERAMMVYNAIYSVPELYQLLVYGIEGEHYTVNADGTITTPYGSTPSAENDYGCNNWSFGTCENAFVTQADVPGYYDMLKEAEADARINPFLKFSFDTTNVAAQVSALSAIDGEYRKALCWGYTEDWEATYNKYVAERKAAGVDEVIAEFQKQLDEFIKANNIQ